MPTMEVWHVNNTPAARERRLSYEFGEGDAPHFPEDYILVAKVDGEDLDHAYELTNHIDLPWYGNPGVEVLAKSRSTSKADVILLDGTAYRVARIGFEAMTPNPHLTVVE